MHKCHAPGLWFVNNNHKLLKVANSVSWGLTNINVGVKHLVFARAQSCVVYRGRDSPSGGNFISKNLKTCAISGNILRETVIAFAYFLLIVMHMGELTSVGECCFYEFFCVGRTQCICGTVSKQNISRRRKDFIEERTEETWCSFMTTRRRENFRGPEGEGPARGPREWGRHRLNALFLNYKTTGKTLDTRSHSVTRNQLFNTNSNTYRLGRSV